MFDITITCFCALWKVPFRFAKRVASAKHMKQQLARRRRGIYAFGERTEGDLFFFQRVHDG
jgi:hypothetical protein